MIAGLTTREIEAISMSNQTHPALDQSVDHPLHSFRLSQQALLNRHYSQFPPHHRFTPLMCRIGHRTTAFLRISICAILLDIFRQSHVTIRFSLNSNGIMFQVTIRADTRL